MDWSKEIYEFQKNGTYDYIFDDGGNLVFNSSSLQFNQHFLSIPLKNFSYNVDKIKSFYNLEFEDFIPTPTLVVKNTTLTTDDVDSNSILLENQELKNKLSSLIKSDETDSSKAENLAIKQIIIDLRIKLREGMHERDFSSTFPYLPIINKK